MSSPLQIRGVAPATPAYYVVRCNLACVGFHRRCRECLHKVDEDEGVGVGQTRFGF